MVASFLRSNRLRLVALLPVGLLLTLSLQGCGDSKSADTTTTTTTTTSSSKSPSPAPAPTPTPSPTPSPTPARAASRADVEKSCPQVHDFCDKDAVCSKAWTCMASMTSCEDGSTCIQDVATISPPTPGLEELAGCLQKTCESPAPSPSPSPTPTPTPTPTPPGAKASRDDVERVCPQVHTFCDGDTGCSQAWTCMAPMTTCEEGSKCIKDEATIAPPSPGLEELASCLGRTCEAPSPSPSPEPTPSPSPSPGSGKTRDDVEKYCPKVHDYCDDDEVCASAWSCMADMKDCGAGSKCIEKTAETSVPTPAFEKLMDCVVGACKSTEGEPVELKASVVEVGKRAGVEDMLPYCPPHMDTWCTLDPSCRLAFACMEEQMNSCREGRACLKEADAAIGTSIGLDILKGCLTDFCNSEHPAQVIV